MPVREIAFELECFEWADERLEVAGRWKGLAGRRLSRPVLTVETEGGRRKHLVAMPGGHFGAAEESWRAAFDWPGDPAEITGAELEVGGSVVVDLPLPDRRRRRRRRPPVDPGDEALRAEIDALRGQVERLRAELAGRERENMQLRAQAEEDDVDVADAGAPTVEIERQQELTAELERLAGERDTARAERAAEVERLQGERAELTEEVQRLHRELDRTRVELERLRDEGDRARSEIDDLREAFSEAAAEAEESRDRHRAEVGALEEELRAERVAVARLTAKLVERPELPPPATGSARRAAAEPAPAAEETQSLPALVDTAAVPGALDPPGPVRDGGRPSAPPTADEAGAPPAGTDELAAGPGEPDAGVAAENGSRAERPDLATRASASLQALKSRLESLFASNGHAAAEDEPGAAREEAIPGPRRTASAARARAGATVAARRSPAELWALRIVAAAVVAVLLIAFVLILASIA